VLGALSESSSRNGNVIGLVNGTDEWPGFPWERYEYTPYGQRTVYHGTDEDWMMWKAQPMYPRLESTRVKPPRRESKTRRSLGEGGRRGFLFGKKRNPPKPLAGEGG